MKTNISTRIVDEWWLDDDTYVVYCDTFKTKQIDGKTVDCHLEVEWWEDEKSYHFICVLDYDTYLPTLEELPQEKREELIKHIEAKINA